MQCRHNVHIGQTSIVVTAISVVVALIPTTTMSFKKVALYPCNPSTARGVATKLSESKDKIAYTNGRTVIVRISY